MQKVTVKFNYTNCNNDLSPLLKSDRKYQNVIIGFEHRQLQASGVEPKIKAFLKKFSKSIVKLATSHDIQRICELPKLKELKYKNLNDNFKFLNYFCSNGLLTMCPNISKLDIKYKYLDYKKLAILQEAIKNMRNLKSLAVNHINIFENFKPGDCKFRLEELTAGSYYYRYFSDEKYSYDFLKQHQSTLKVLKIDILSLEDISFVLSEFPKLHTLHINKVFNYYEKLEFPENLTVKNFLIHCCVNYELEIQKIAELLTKLKNLQTAGFYVLYSRFLPELFACKSLTLVKYRTFHYLGTEDQTNFMNNNENIKFIHF